MSVKKRVTIRNTSNQPVGRAGKVFHPGITTVSLTDYQKSQVTAHVSLFEVRKPKEATATTQEETAPAEGYDTPEGEVDTSEEEGVQCPHCDFVAKNENGLRSHMRKHDNEEDAEPDAGPEPEQGEVDPDSTA